MTGESVKYHVNRIKQANFVSLCGNMDPFQNPHGCQTEPSTFPLAHCETQPTSDHLLSSLSQVKLLFLVLATRCLNLMDVAPTSLVFLFQRGYVFSICSWQIYGELCHIGSVFDTVLKT